MWLIKSVLSALLLFFWNVHAQPTLDTDQQKIVDIIAKFYCRDVVHMSFVLHHHLMAKAAESTQ